MNLKNPIDGTRSPLRGALPVGEGDAMEFAPLSGTFGAMALNTDLAAPLGTDRIEQLRDALYRHKVIVFRNQHDVGPGELLELARHFGEPETAAHHSFPDVEGFPGVKLLVTDAADRPEPMDTWHTDGATRKSTKAVTLLQAIDVPPYGRDTAFCDMEAIYNSLSPALQAMLEGLTARHAYGPRAAHVPPQEHPVVKVNPVTGRKSLYVSRLYTDPIIGLKQDESNALLQMLFAKANLLEFQLRVAWEPGTLIMWDNEVTQHYVVMDRAYRRVMHRVMAL